MSSSDTESYYDSCEEEYIEQDIKISTIELLENSYIDKHTYDNHYIKEHKKINLFIKNIRLFINNNPLDRKHVENIKDNLRKDNNLVGIFTTVQFANDTIMLIDGHHRITALRELQSEGNKIISPLDIHNYKCISETSEDTMLLFEKVNNTKPFRTDVEIIKTVMHVIQKISDKFPKLFSKAKKRANFPKLHEKTFSDLLYLKMKKINMYDDVLILKILLSFNNKNINMSKEKFLKDIKQSKNYEKIKDRYEKFKSEGGLFGCFKESIIIDELENFNLK